MPRSCGGLLGEEAADEPFDVGGSGKVIVTTLGDPEEIRQKVDWGYKFLNLGSPIGFGISFINDRFVEYREQAGN